MPPYSTKDLPEAGRRSESLGKSVSKSVSFDQASFASHSDCISLSALRSRSSSPSSLEAVKSASDIGKDSSTSQSFTKGSVSEDDVFFTNESFPTHDHGNERRTETEVGLVVRNPPYVDPQVIYSPKACVFIANLSRYYDDVILKTEVTKLFSEYGQCFTKIKRDKDNTPIAFCQFTQIDHANMAHIHGHGRIILDRDCRVEMARGNLTFLVWKRSGERTSLQEANSLLEPHGALAKVENLEKEVQDRYFLPLSVIVEFEKFDAHRDVLGCTKGHPVFMVNLLSTVLSTRPPSKEQHRLEMEDQAELEQFYKNARSIYVGNLPPCANEDLVRVITAPCGVVLSIQMKQITSTSGAVFRHAFVEFDNTDSPTMAVKHCHGRVVEGYPIRVQHKRRKLPNTPQRNSSGVTTPASSFHQRARSFHRSASSNSSFVRPPRHPRQQSVVDPWLASSTAMTLRAPTGPSAGTRYLTNAPSQVTSQPLAGGHTHVEQPVTRALPQIDGPQAHPQPAVTQDCSEQVAAQACPQPAGSQAHSERVATQTRSEPVVPQARSEPVVPQAHTQPADSQASSPAAIQESPQPSATRTFSVAEQAANRAWEVCKLTEKLKRLRASRSFSTAEQAANRAEEAAERAEKMKLRRATSLNILDTHPEASEDDSLSPSSGDESSDDDSTSPEKPAETFKNEAKSSGNVTKRGTKTVNSEAIVTENGSQPVFDTTSMVITYPPQQFMQMGQQSQPFINPGYTNADMQMQAYILPPMVHQNMPNGMAHMNNNQGYTNNNQGDINHAQGPMNNTQAHMYNAMANMQNAQAPMYNAQGQMLNAMPQQMHTQPNAFFPTQGMNNAMPPMHQQANPYPVQQYPPQGMQMPNAMAQGMAPNMSFGYPQNRFQQHAPLQSAHHQLSPYPQPIQYQTPHHGFTHNGLGGQMHHSTVTSIPLETPTAGPMPGQIQGQGQSGTQQQAATVAKQAN